MRETGEGNYPHLACDVGQVILRMILDQGEEKHTEPCLGPPVMDTVALP